MGYRIIQADSFSMLVGLSGLVVTFCAMLLSFLLYEDLHKPPTLPNQKSTIAYATPIVQMDEDKVENGIHLATGLVFAEGFALVKPTCTHCHSAKLITQNRATREGWAQMIDWMQETQGLWDLGPSRAAILDYLAAHYAPEETGRRPVLEVAAIEWYYLEE